MKLSTSWHVEIMSKKIQIDLSLSGKDIEKLVIHRSRFSNATKPFIDGKRLTSQSFRLSKTKFLSNCLHSQNLKSVIHNIILSLFVHPQL